FFFRAAPVSGSPYAGAGHDSATGRTRGTSTVEQVKGAYPGPGPVLGHLRPCPRDRADLRGTTTSSSHPTVPGTMIDANGQEYMAGMSRPETEPVLVLHWPLRSRRQHCALERSAIAG